MRQDNPRKRQAKFSGLPKNTGHRSHKSGSARWVRVWRDREHVREMKAFREVEGAH